MDHSSLKASHDNEGLRKETANNIEILRVNTMDTVDEINKMLTKKVAGLTDDVASLNDALSTEKADRTTSDDNLNTKLLQQCEKVSMIATTDARTPTLSWSCWPPLVWMMRGKASLDRGGVVCAQMLLFSFVLTRDGWALRVRVVKLSQVRDALAREMQQRADEANAQHKAVESTLQNVFMSLQQEKQQREEELSSLQQGLCVHSHSRVLLAAPSQTSRHPPPPPCVALRACANHVHAI